MTQQRILILLPDLSGGGAERLHIKLANYWHEQGVSVDFVLMSPQEIEDALGWTVGGQIKGYATGLRRRLSCSIISRMVR